MTTYRLLYPKYRTATVDQIVSWWQDAIADGKLPVPEEGVYVPTSEMIHALEDLGLITVARATPAEVMSRVCDQNNPCPDCNCIWGAV